MAYSTIIKPNTNFTPTIYSGTSASHAVSVGFQPDLVWLKPRSVADNHRLMNSVSGAGFYLMSNATNGESASGTRFTSFDTDGFTLGDADEGWNQSGQTYASWNWLAGGTASSNTDGTITSSVSANTTNGFSVVSFTGTGANATVGHGLGVAPKWIIVKSRGVENWRVYSSYLGATKAMALNGNNAEDTDSSYWNNVEPTSSLFTVGTNAGTNGSSVNMIAYCFADVKGFSKMGSYTGNGSTDGTFIYTGFSPSFIMFKNASVTESWTILDLKRASVPNANPNAEVLWPNDNFAEYDETQGIDFLSNGFKVRESATGFNGSGNTIIYMAFAENPLVGTNNVPATAR